MNLIGITGRMRHGKDTIGLIIQYLDFKRLYPNSDRTFQEFVNEEEYKLCVGLQNWKIKKFAFKLKLITSILTGIPVEDLEKQEVKKRELGEEWDYGYETHLVVRTSNKRISAKKYPGVPYKYTVRELLQIVGTEAMRENVHEEVWVNALFSDWKCLADKSLYLLDPSNTDEKMVKLGEKRVEDRFLGQYPYWVITDVRFPNEAEAIKQRGGVIIKVDSTDRIGKVSDEHISETAMDSYPHDHYIDNNGTIEDLIEKVEDFLINY